MKISSKFTIAVHTLLLIHYFNKKHKITSNFIASSVNVNPVIIRNILLKLKNAHIVDIKAGSGGATLIKKLDEISLFDIYTAVDSVSGDLFHFHKTPNPNCPIGKNIHNLLDIPLVNAQKALETELKKITLNNLIDNLNKL